MVPVPTAAKTKKRPRKSGEGGLVANFRYDLKNNKGLLGLTLPAVAWFLVFAYAPMLGLVIAFQKYSPAKGIFGSEFVFLDNFRFFFGSQDFVRVTVNTLVLNTLFILATNFVAILMAIALSEIKNKYFKKVSQSVIILPHFISWTVVALLIEAFLKTEGGFVNNILATFGAEPIKFMQTPELWPAILTILRVWQGAGYSSIVYLAAITGFDQSMYEAARVDGATRLQCITRITLPLLRPTVVLLLLMAVGKIFNGDEWPDIKRQNDALNKVCTEQAENYMGGEENLYQSTLTPFWTTQPEESWVTGSRQANCALIATEGDGFATLKGYARQQFTVNGKPPKTPPKRLPKRGDSPAPAPEGANAEGNPAP